MSKAILMSIRPEWCALICEGKKTVEVRKTRPKLETPFKVYIYETKGKTETPWMDEDGHMVFCGRGKVVGEFICDTTRYENGSVLVVKEDRERAFEGTCLNRDDIIRYLKGGNKDRKIFLPNLDLYMWHISELKVYDKPKDLSKFTGLRKTKFGYEPIPTRPPQSWCYVEEL